MTLEQVIHEPEAKLKTGIFAMPKDGPIVRAQLRGAGFSPDDINTIVDNSGWSMAPIGAGG